jgi:hypothetical protein
MKTTRILAGCALAMCFAGSALAETSVRFNVSFGNAPPPPVIVVQHAPRTVWMPEQRVYVASDRDFDDDYFQCGAFWYVYHDNWWYRARTWRGPYAVIDYRDVPQSVVVVPARHWKHHYAGMPPGWAKRDRRDAMYVDQRGPVVEERRHDNGHGNGNSNGHGKGHDKNHGKGHDRDDD